MKKNMIIPIVLAILAMGLSFVLARQSAPPSTKMVLERVRDVSFLASQLDLDDRQAADIRRLHEKLSDTLADCCDRHCASREKLGALLAENGQAEAIEEEIRLMTQAYEESERAASAHIMAVMAALNPDQKRRFAKLVEGSLCGGHVMQGCSMTSSVHAVESN